MATEQRTSGTGEVTQAQPVCQFNVSARLMSGESAGRQEDVRLHNYEQQKHPFIFYYLLSCTLERRRDDLHSGDLNTR